MDARGATLIPGLDPESAELLARGGGEVQGYVPRYEAGGRVSLVHWRDATYHTDKRGRRRPNRRVWKMGEVPEPVMRAMLEGLPPIVRREAQERYDALVRQLLADMNRVKQVLGRYEIPTSIAAQIRQVAWVEGDPTLMERIEQVEPAAVEVYAKFLMRDAAHRQREKDQHKVTKDWHGHYNDTIHVGGMARNVPLTPVGT